MRKGWFKKAKKKFIRKRVYKWELTEVFGAYVKYEIIFIHNEGAKLLWISRDNQYQVLKKALSLGFVDGFIYARKKHVKAPKSWLFFYDKRIE